MEEGDIIRRALWFANRAPVGLAGVYRRLRVHRPGAMYTIKRRGWRARLRPQQRSASKKISHKQAEATYELQKWLRTQLKRIAKEDPNQVSRRVGSVLKVNFWMVDIDAGEALVKVLHGGGYLPIELFVVYAAALLADPERPWRAWLRECICCKKIFYAEPTGGARTKLCSEKCKRAQAAKRTRRFREKFKRQR